jgi:hypothetical protein
VATPLVVGREFSEQDTEKSEKVAVVNETFVRQLMPFVKSPQEAIDRRFSVGETTMRIVGVAKERKYFNIAEGPRAFVWIPLIQDYSTGGIVLVRTVSNPEALIGPVRIKSNLLIQRYQSSM